MTPEIQTAALRALTMTKALLLSRPMSEDENLLLHLISTVLKEAGEE